MPKLQLLNGPNLNLLGRRETAIYGKRGLDEIVDECARFAQDCGFELDHLQSNAEARLIDAVQAAPAAGVDGIVLNPAGFTHTSVALRDSLLAVRLPFVEVHLSQPAARESFRQVSYFSDIALGTIAGFGGDGYLLAVQALINYLDTNPDGHSQDQETD